MRRYEDLIGQEGPRIVEKKKSNLKKAVVGVTLVAGTTLIVTKVFPNLSKKMYKKLLNKPTQTQNDDNMFE